MTHNVQWYTARDGQQAGPISDAELRRRVGDGTVSQRDLVWHDGMAEWTPAGRVPGLFAGPVPPPLPPVRMNYATPAGPPPGEDLGQNAGMRMLLPVGRSGWAIAAGYAGLFSLIPIFAPLAIVLGLIALRDLKRHPDRHGAGRAWFGLIAGTLSIALFGALIFVAAR